MKGWNENSSLTESMDDVRECLSSHLWIKRILMYSIIGFIASVFTHMFAHSNLFYIESDSAQYLLSALVQSQAAIIGIVITLTFIAVQLIFSYSPRAVGVALKRNYGMWMILTFYGVSIFYGLSVLRMIPNKSDVPLSQNTDFLTLWGSTASIEYRIGVVYCLGILTFVAIVPYILNTVNFLNPANIIKILSHDITESTILKHIKSVEKHEKDRTKPIEEDPVQPTVDMIRSSLIKHDFVTTSSGITAITNRAIDIMNSYSFNISAEYLLFSTDVRVEGIINNLNNGIVPEELQSMFETPLSENVSVTKKDDRNRKWVVIDKDEEKTYIVDTSEDGKLNIYAAFKNDLGPGIVSGEFRNEFKKKGHPLSGSTIVDDVSYVINPITEVPRRVVWIKDENSGVMYRVIENDDEELTVLIDLGTETEISEYFCKHFKEIIRLTTKVDETSTIDVIKNLETLGKSTAEKKLEHTTLEVVKSLEDVGKTATMRELFDVALYTTKFLGIVGKVAAENKLREATAKSVSILGVVGKIAVEKGREYEHVASRATFYLGIVGETATKNELMGEPSRVVRSLSEIGKIAVEKELNSTVEQVAISLIRVGTAAIEKELVIVPLEPAECLAKLSKSTILSGDIVKQVIHDYPRLIMPGWEYFKKFKELYDHELKKP